MHDHLNNIKVMSTFLNFHGVGEINFITQFNGCENVGRGKYERGR